MKARVQVALDIVVAWGLLVAPGAAQRALHLPSGDSVIVIGSGPARVPDKPDGLLIKYHTFVAMTDTATLRREALEMWHHFFAKIDSLSLSWVVFQATTQTPPPFIGIERGQMYGFVLEKRGDGKWYFLDGTIPLAP